MKYNVNRVPTNSTNQHGSPGDPSASPTAPEADREASASPARETGAAFHPEIIDKASQWKVSTSIKRIGVAEEPVRTNLANWVEDHPLMGHYCNMDRCHSLSPEDLQLSDSLIAAIEPGEHKGICGPFFSCITERKGNNGAVFTITCEDKLFALLGVATTEQSSSIVWDWLEVQYEILRRASLAVNFRSKNGGVELRRKRIIGDTYFECSVPTKPRRCPWFSYIVNSNVFHQHLIHYPKDTQILGSLAYGWWSLQQPSHDWEGQATRFEIAA